MMKRFVFLMDLDTWALLKQLASDDKETIANYLRRLIRQQKPRAAKES